MEKYIYHHMGLGDHFTCNGLVRHYYKQFNKIYLFCYKHFEDNIKFMYRDLPNLQTIGLGSDIEVDEYILKNNLFNQLIKIGFDKSRSLQHQVETFDEGFYLAENLPFSIRFDEYFVERNMDKEMELYKTLNPTDEDFIFVHEDPERGMFLDKSRIRQDLKIIGNDKKFLIFDYIYLLSKSKEVHVMQSSLKDMINSYSFPNTKCILHNYVRNYDSYANTKGLNQFEILY
jgi:hypothetical protein